LCFEGATHQSRSRIGGTDDEETKLKKSKALAKKALQRLWRLAKQTWFGSMKAG